MVSFFSRILETHWTFLYFQAKTIATTTKSTLTKLPGKAYKVSYATAYGIHCLLHLSSKNQTLALSVSNDVTYCLAFNVFGFSSIYFSNMLLKKLSFSKFQPLAGTFRPSPHPMESFILVSVNTVVEGADVKADQITHALTYNYKISTKPEGFPVIIEERTCLAAPCIVPQMAKTNAGFAVQAIQARDEDIYNFAQWNSLDVVTNTATVSKKNLFEEIAASDYFVTAEFEKVAYTIDAALGFPQVGFLP